MAKREWHRPPPLLTVTVPWMTTLLRFDIAPNHHATP
jgi:hypothetical protein